MVYQAIFISTCLLSSALCIAIPACGQSQAEQDSIAFYGIASYYDATFNGQLTANGDTFYAHYFTAASNQLPMDRYVLVTNLRNRRKVVVRINDRMAPDNQRLIDVSEAAARKLGFKARGITRVKVQLIPAWMVNWFDLASLDSMQQPNHKR